VGVLLALLLSWHSINIRWENSVWKAVPSISRGFVRWGGNFGILQREPGQNSIICQTRSIHCQGKTKVQYKIIPEIVFSIFVVF
jgi:hypothetical protein